MVTGFEISILNFKHGLSKTFDMEFFMGDLKYKLKSIEGIEKVSLKINNEDQNLIMRDGLLHRFMSTTYTLDIEGFETKSYIICKSTINNHFQILLETVKDLGLIDNNNSWIMPEDLFTMESEGDINGKFLSLITF